MTPAELIEQIALSIGVRARLVTTGDQLRSDDELFSETVSEVDSDAAELKRTLAFAMDVQDYPAELKDATRAEFRERVEDHVDAVYGTLDIQSWAERYPCLPITYKPVDECDHVGEYPTLGGMFCIGCGRTREPVGQFETSLVSRLNPRWGYVIGGQNR